MKKLICCCILFLLIAAANSLHNPYCALSCNFGSNSIAHTVCERGKVKCGPDAKCGPDFKVVQLKDSMRQYVVNLHNALRNKVATGKEKRGNQPPASNMNVMSYNMELEFLAQCWANKCHGNPLIHDVCRSTKRYEHVGQNLAYINSSVKEIDFKIGLKRMVMHWYDEVAIFKNEWLSNTQDRGPNFKIGHYTQMLWADTTEVGCAVSYFTTLEPYFKKKWHFYLLVCNYGPGGNYLGAPVYHKGHPCQSCHGRSCNKDFKALCGKSVNMTQIDRSFVPIFKL